MPKIEFVNIRKAEVKNGGGEKRLEWHEVKNGGGENEKAAPSPEIAASPETPATGAPSPNATSSTTRCNPRPNEGARPSTANNSPFQHSGHAALLRETTNMLIDVLANCKNYSAKYSGVISADDVRSCLLSVYINLSKGAK